MIFRDTTCLRRSVCLLRSLLTFILQVAELMVAADEEHAAHLV